SSSSWPRCCRNCIPNLHEVTREVSMTVPVIEATGSRTDDRRMPAGTNGAVRSLVPTRAAERLRRRLSEERLVLAREAAQFVETVKRRDIRDGGVAAVGRAKRTPVLMELPEPKEAHRTERVHFIERVAQA